MSDQSTVGLNNLKSKLFNKHRLNSSLKITRNRISKFILFLPLLLLLVGGAAAFYLVKINQDIRQEASTNLYAPAEPTSVPTSVSTPTPTPANRKCFLSSINSYVDPGTTACGGTKQCVECQNGQWNEVDRNKCAGDPYCGPNINCSYAQHGGYACLSMTECVRCWDGETQRNQASSNCKAPCGNLGVTPKPVKTPTPTPRIVVTPGAGGSSSKAGCYSVYTGGCPAGLEAAQSSQCGGCDSMQVCCVKTEQCNCDPGEVMCNYNIVKTCKSDCKTWTEQQCPTGYQCYNNQCTNKDSISIGTGDGGCRFDGQACKSEYFEETTRAGLTIGTAKCYYSTCAGTGTASSCTGGKKCVSFDPLGIETTEPTEKTSKTSKTTEKLEPSATPIPEEVAKTYLQEGAFCGILTRKECLPGLACSGFPIGRCQKPSVAEEEGHQGGEKTGGLECNLGEHHCVDGVEYACTAEGKWANPQNCAYGCGNQACLLPTPTPIPAVKTGESACRGQGEAIGLLAGSTCCPGLEARLSNFALRCEPIKNVSCREAFVQSCNPDNNGVAQGEQICYFTKQDTKTGLCNLNVKDCGPCQTGKVSSYRDKANGAVCNTNYECQSGQCIPDVQGHKTCQDPSEIKAECSGGETKCEWWNSSYWQYTCQQGTFVRTNLCEGGCSGNQCAASVCTYPSSQCSDDGTKLLICKQTQTGYLEYNCEGGCEAGVCQEKEKCGLFNPCRDNFRCVKGQCIPEGVEGNACKGPAFIMPCTYSTSQGTVEVGEQFCWYSQLDKNGQCTQEQVCENVCSITGTIVQENRTPAYPTATPTKVPPTPIPTASTLADLLDQADIQVTVAPTFKPLANPAVQDLIDTKELTLSQLEKKSDLSQEEVTNLMNAKFARSYKAVSNNDLEYLRNQCKAELGSSNSACSLSTEKILQALYPKIETAYIFDQIEEDRAFTTQLNQKFGQYLTGGYSDLQIECVSLTGKPELCSNEQQVLEVVIPGVTTEQVRNIIAYKQEETQKYYQLNAKIASAQQETINTYLTTNMQVLYDQCKTDNPDDYKKCSTQEGILAYLVPGADPSVITNLASQKRLVEQENRNLEQLYQDYLGGRNVQDLVEQKCQLVAKSSGQDTICQGDDAGKIVFGLDDAQLALRKENITSRILNRDQEWASETLVASSNLQGVEKFSYNLMTSMASTNWFGNSVENYVNVQTDFANQYTGGDKFLATLELSGAVMEKVAVASAVFAVPIVGAYAIAGGASALGVGATVLGTTQVSLAGSNFFGAGSQTAAVCRNADDALNDPACLQQGANLALAGANFVLAPVTGSLTAAKQGVQLTGLMGSGAQGIIGTAQTATSLVASNAQQLGYGLGLANTTLAASTALQTQQLTDWASVGGSVLNTVAGTAGLLSPENAVLNLGTDILADVSGSMLDYYALQNTANLNPNDQFAQTRALLGLVVGLGQAGFEVQSDVSNFRNSQPVRSLGGADVPKLDPLLKTQQTLLDVAKIDNSVKLDTTLSDPYFAKAKYYEDLVKANQTDIDAIVGKLSKEPNLAESEKLALATVRDDLIKQNTDFITQKDSAYKIYETKQQEQTIRLAKAILPETIIADAQIKLEAVQTQKQIIEQQKIELESKIAKAEESVKIAEQIGDVTQAEQIKSQRGELEVQLDQADAELARVNQELEQQRQAIQTAVAQAQAEATQVKPVETAEGEAQPAVKPEAEQPAAQTAETTVKETVGEEVSSTEVVKTEVAKSEAQEAAQAETAKSEAVVSTQPNIFQRIQETVGGWFGRGGQTVSTQEVKTETAKVEETQQTAQQQAPKQQTSAEFAQELQTGFNQAKQSIQEIAQTEGDVRKLTERINSFDNAIKTLDSKLVVNQDNQDLISQRTNLEQQKLQLQQSLDSTQAKLATLNQDDNFSKSVLVDLTTIRPETTAQSTKNQAEQLRNQVATELGKKSASEVDLTKIEADLISQNGGQRTLAVEQQLNQALRKLKQATLLDTVADLQQKFASLDPTSVEALRVISDIDQLLQTRELNIPQVSSDPQKNLQIENIIRSAELRAGQSEGIAFFNTRSNQLSTLAQILSSPKVAVELTTAGGKSFVGGLVLEIQKTVYGRDKGIYIAKAGGEADIANQLRAMSPEGTKVVEFDQNKFLQDKTYQAEVLAADYLVSTPDQIQFLRNTAHNYSLGSTRDVAVSLYKNLSSNVGVYVDELQINMDPSRQAINPTGESSRPIAQNQKDAANLVGESILDTGLINRWGSGDHEGVLTVREADGAEVARFTNDTLDKIFTQLKVKNGENSAFKGMSETEISDLVDYVRSNAQELEILSSNTNALASRLEAAGFKDSSAQVNQVLDQIDQINSFAQGLKMKFGVDYFRDVDSQLQANNANNRTKDPVTIPAAGGVKNEGQSYTASLQAAMEFIGAKAYAQANPGVNNAASKVNFDGLTFSPETAYRSTFADYLADLNNSSVGAVTGAFADGRGVVETTLGFDTYRDTEAVEKIVNTADTDIGARINKARSYMASGLEDSTQLIVDLIRSGKLAQSNGLDSQGSVKYVVGSDDLGDTMRIAQADAQGRDFSDKQRYFVQQGGDHYVEVEFVRTVDSAGNETISRKILNDNLDAKGVQKLYQDNPANMTIVIGRGGATGDSIRTEGNVPGVTLVSKNSPEGLVAQAGARLDRGADVADQYAIILDSTRASLDFSADVNTRLATANEFDFQEFRQSINEAQLRVEQLKTTQGLDNGIESASTRVLAELSMSADSKIASWASAKLLEMSSVEFRRNVDLAGGSQDTLSARQAKLASAQAKWQELFNDSANQSILKYIETNDSQAFARMRSNVEVDANRLAYADQNAPISKEAVVNSGDLSEYLLQHNATVKKTDDVAKVAAGNNFGKNIATGVVAPSATSQPTLLAGTRRVMTAVSDNFSARQATFPKGGVVNTALLIPRTVVNGAAAFLETTWPTIIKPAIVATYFNKPIQITVPATQEETPTEPAETPAEETAATAQTTTAEKPSLGTRLSDWVNQNLRNPVVLSQWLSGGFINISPFQKLLSNGLLSLLNPATPQEATPTTTKPTEEAQPAPEQPATGETKVEENIQGNLFYRIGNWFGGVAKDLGFGQETTTPAEQTQPVQEMQPEVEQPSAEETTPTSEEAEQVAPVETVIFGGVEFKLSEIKERTIQQKTMALTNYLADRGLGQYSAAVRALSEAQITDLHAQVFETKEVYTYEQATKVLLNFLGVEFEIPTQIEQPAVEPAIQTPAESEQPGAGGTTQEETYLILPYTEVTGPLVPYGGYPSLPNYAKELADAREQQEYLAQMMAYDQPSTTLVSTTLDQDLADTEELEQGDTRTVDQTPTLPVLTDTEVVKEYLPVLYDSRAVEFNWLVDAADQVMERVTGQGKVAQALEAMRYSPVMKVIQPAPAQETDLANYPITLYREAPLARIAETLTSTTQTEESSTPTMMMADRGPIPMFMQAIPLMNTLGEVQSWYAQYQAWLARRDTLASLADQYNLTANFATQPTETEATTADITTETPSEESVIVEPVTEEAVIDQTNYPIVLTAEQAKYPLARIEGRELAQVYKQPIIARDTLLASVYDSVPVGPINQILALLPQYQAFVKAQTANQQQLGKMFKAWADQLAKLKTESTEEVAAETALTEPVVEEPSPELTLEEQLEQVKAKIAELDQQIAEINAQYDPRYKAYNDGLYQFEQNLDRQVILTRFKYKALENAKALNGLIDDINNTISNRRFNETDLLQMDRHISKLVGFTEDIFNSFGYSIEEENQALYQSYKQTVGLGHEYLSARRNNKSKDSLVELLLLFQDRLMNFKPLLAPHFEGDQDTLNDLLATLQQQESDSDSAKNTYQQAHQSEKEQIEALRDLFMKLDTQKTALLKQENYLTQAIVDRDYDLLVQVQASLAREQALAESQLRATRWQLFNILDVTGLSILRSFVENLSDTGLLNSLLATWSDANLSPVEKLTSTFKILPIDSTKAINSRIDEAFILAQNLEELKINLNTYLNDVYYILIFDDNTNSFKLFSALEFRKAIDKTINALNTLQPDEAVRATLADWPNYAPIQTAGEQLVEIAIAQRQETESAKRAAFYADYHKQQEQLASNLVIRSDTRVAELKTLAQNPSNQQYGWLADNNAIVGVNTVLAWLDRIDFEDTNQVLPSYQLPISPLRNKVQELLNLRKSEQARIAAEKYQQAQTVYSEFLSRLSLTSDTTVTQLEALASDQFLTIDTYLKMFGLNRQSTNEDLTQAKRQILSTIYIDNYKMLETAYLLDSQTNREVQALLVKLEAATKLLNRALIDVEKYLDNPEAYLRTHGNAYSNPDVDPYIQQVASTNNWSELFIVLDKLLGGEELNNLIAEIYAYRTDKITLDGIPVDYGVRAKVAQLKKIDDLIKSSLARAKNLDELAELISQREEISFVADTLKQFAKGEISARNLTELYGIRRLAEQLLAKEKASYLDQLSRLPVLENLMPQLRLPATNLAQLKQIWNSVNNFGFVNFRRTTLEGTQEGQDIRFNFSLLIAQFERILGQSGSLYRRPINDINNAQNISELIDVLKRNEERDVFLDNETFYTSAEVKADRQTLEALVKAWRQRDYTEVERLRNQLEIGVVKSKVSAVFNQIYERNINLITAEALNALSIEQFRTVLMNAGDLYKPGNIFENGGRALIITNDYLVQSLDNIIAGRISAQDFPLENLRTRIDGLLSSTRRKDLPFQKVSFANLKQQYNNVRQAFETGSYQNSSLLNFWRSIVRDFEGRWMEYVTSHHFKGRQAQPTQEAKAYLTASLATKEEFLDGLADGKYRQDYQTYKNWLIELHKKAAYKGEGGVLQHDSGKGSYHSSGHTKVVLGKENTDGILTIARRYGDPYVNSGTQYLHLPGIPKEYASSDMWSRYDYMTHFYPKADSIDNYFAMAQQNLIKAIETSPDNNQQFLTYLAAFYQYSINCRAFKEVNNSLFMNLVNTLLEARGLKPVEQGILDFAAVRLQQQTFTSYFIDEVKRINPGLNVQAIRYNNLQSDPNNLPATFKVEFTIGSDVKGGQSIKIKDKGVSPQHLRIYKDTYSGEWNLQNFNLNDTTLVNGKRVYGVVMVSDGTIIQIGQNAYRLEIKDDKIKLNKLKDYSFNTGSYNPNGCSSCPIAFGEFNTRFNSFFIAQSLANTTSVEADKADLQALNQTAQAQVAVLKNMANDHTFTDNAPAQETLDALAETADAMLKKTEAEKAQALAEMDEAFQTIDQAISQITAAQDSAQNQAITDLTTLKNELKLISAELEALQVKPSNGLAGVLERIQIQLEDIALYVRRISGDVSRMMRPEEEITESIEFL